MSFGRFLQRLRRARREYGSYDFTLLCLQRALGWIPGLRLERHYLVAQPVTTVAAATRGRNIRVERLTQQSGSLREIERIPQEIDDRFAQGAVCLGAFDGDTLLGWIWLAFNRFRDFDEPFMFLLPEDGSVAWDLDVYVRPEYRFSPVFPRLWAAATEKLQEKGAHWTASTISGFNPASLAAHRRLGARTLGAIVVIRLGPLRYLAGRELGIPRTWTWGHDYRHEIRVRVSD